MLLMKWKVSGRLSNGTRFAIMLLGAVHPSRNSLPKGQIFHVAGPSADGWTIVAVHDSKESWERFRDEILMPQLKKGIKGGLTVPPQETTFQVHNLQK
jgi:hypothetical protein